MILDYDALVKDYYEGLFTRLRKFSPGPEFLEAWVHDEDHQRSIISVFEAAANARLPFLTLQVSHTVDANLEKKDLLNSLSEMGETSHKAYENHFEVSVHFREAER